MVRSQFCKYNMYYVKFNIRDIPSHDFYHSISCRFGQLLFRGHPQWISNKTILIFILAIFWPNLLEAYCDLWKSCNSNAVSSNFLLTLSRNGKQPLAHKFLQNRAMISSSSYNKLPGRSTCPSYLTYTWWRLVGQCLSGDRHPSHTH